MKKDAKLAHILNQINFFHEVTSNYADENNDFDNMPFTPFESESMGSDQLDFYRIGQHDLDLI